MRAWPFDLAGKHHSKSYLALPIHTWMELVKRVELRFGTNLSTLAKKVWECKDAESPMYDCLTQGVEFGAKTFAYSVDVLYAVLLNLIQVYEHATVG